MEWVRTISGAQMICEHEGTIAVTCSRFEKVLGFDLVDLNIGLRIEQRRLALPLQPRAGNPPDSFRERLFVWLQAL